jgi:hypothetical protein
VTPFVPQTAQTIFWSGAASNLWSNPNNWNPVRVPAVGDYVVLPAGAANLSSTIDLPAGTTFLAIQFDGDNYSVGGNAIVTGALYGFGGNNRLTLPVSSKELRQRSMDRLRSKVAWMYRQTPP